MLLRRSCRARSRREYDQLSALKPRLGLARDLWRSKELRTRQPLHDLPPSRLAASRRCPILPLIAAISWHEREHAFTDAVLAYD